MFSLTVIVTGAQGFIGRYVTKELCERGHEVVTVVRSGGDASVGSTSIVADWLDGSATERILRHLEGRPRRDLALVHLAAVADPEILHTRPGAGFRSNVALTLQVLEFARRVSCRVLLASTGVLYDKSATPKTELDPVRARSLYGALKLASEALMQGYASEFGLTCDIVRLSNVYGSESRALTVVGRILECVRQGADIRVRDVRSVRDFLHVTDAASGFVAVLETHRESGCEVFNLSTGIGSSVGRVADIAASAAGTTVHREPAGIESASVDQLILANEKIRSTTGWAPQITIEDGVFEGVRANMGGSE